MRLATRRYTVSWPDNSWRPVVWREMGENGGVVLFCKTRAVLWRCWREVRAEVHLARFGYYPDAATQNQPEPRSMQVAAFDAPDAENVAASAPTRQPTSDTRKERPGRA